MYEKKEQTLTAHCQGQGLFFWIKYIFLSAGTRIRLKNKVLDQKIKV